MSIAFALSTAGNLTLVADDPARSWALQQESLRLRYSMHHAVGIARCLDGLGWAASAQGQLAQAAAYSERRTHSASGSPRRRIRRGRQNTSARRASPPELPEGRPGAVRSNLVEA